MLKLFKLVIGLESILNNKFTHHKLYNYIGIRQITDLEYRVTCTKDETSETKVQNLKRN